MTKTVAVIGAGIVGVSTALWLVRDGHRVILIDREGPAAGASQGNGGVLASASIVPVTVPGLVAKAPRMLFDPRQPLFMRWGYLPKLAPWLIRYLRHANARDADRISRAVVQVTGDSVNDHLALARGTAAEGYIVPTDYLYLYTNRAAYDGDKFGWDLRRAGGMRWHEMEGIDLQRYDPIYSDEIGFAVNLPDHGRISDPGAYVRALAGEAEAQGVRFIKGTFEDMVREAGAVTGVRVAGETIPCDAAVLALGAWSKPLADKLGLRVPLESERGYHLELWEPSIMPRAPVMVASGKFVITPMDGRIRLAGVVEFGGLEAGPSRAPFDLLRDNIRRAIPALTWNREVEWMGHRPAPADSIPLIGEVPGIKGAFLGFGHHHIGLTGGPKTGRLLAQMIAGRKPNVDVEVFSPSRFA